MKRTGNLLDELMTEQRALMLALGIDANSGTLNSTGQPSKTEMGAAIGITVESAEILEAMDKANRVWKVKGDTVTSVKEEMIDVIFFILELAVLLNLSGETLVMLYREKHKYNVKRLFMATAGTRGISPTIQNLLDASFTSEEVSEMKKELERMT